MAVIVVGPQRLPEYTRKLTQMVRQLRVFLDNARSQIAEEVGPEMADLDLSSLDPRQYDPRKIVREALFDDPDADIAGEIGLRERTAQSTGATAAGAVGAAGAAAYSSDSGADGVGAGGIGAEGTGGEDAYGLSLIHI